MGKLLITGCAGHIGTMVTQYMLEANQEVIGVDTLMYGGHGLMSLFGNGLFTFYHLDVCDIMPVAEQFKGVTAIIHLAAVVGERACRQNPDVAQQANVDGTGEMVELAKRLGVPIILASTCSLYGAQPGMLQEGCPTQLGNLYTKTKWEAEQLVLDAGGYVLRFGTAVGYSLRPRFDTLAHELIRSAILHNRIELYSPGSYRAWAAIGDIVDAIREVCSTKALAPGIYNVVSLNMDKATLGNLVNKTFGGNLDVVTHSTANDARSYQVSSNKLQDATLWVPWPTRVPYGIEQVANACKLGVISVGDGRWYNA